MSGSLAVQAYERRDAYHGMLFVDTKVATIRGGTRGIVEDVRHKPASATRSSLATSFVLVRIQSTSCESMQ
jgi:hypothetical protein